MNSIARTLAFTLATCLSAGAMADERIQHAKGLPADTLAQAVSNLNSHTLENALQRINAELAEIAESLEAMHIASESNDPHTVKHQGQAYLDGIQPLVR